MSDTNSLIIEDLHAEIGNTKILKGIDLEIKSGELHAVMGPNGSGKSTLCNIIMGHPKYRITKGSIKFNDTEISELKTNERANLGLFLGFQHPVEIPGVPLGNFLRIAKNANAKAMDKDAAQIGPAEFLQVMKEKTELLKMSPKFIGRSVNEGLSGGEKKRTEIVQMAALEPKIALLDEIDSGLDIDALRIVAEGIRKIHETSNTGILLITHYQRILNHISPDFVHVISDGRIIKSGDKNLALELEEKGYESYVNS